jgi:multiple sugar transport system substrate-binding protein
MMGREETGEARRERGTGNPANHNGARFSRRVALGLGAAAGLAGALSPLERAYAAWHATLPRDLQGTVTFQAWLYESGKTNTVYTRQPNKQYAAYMKMHPTVKVQMVPPPTGDTNTWFITHAMANQLPDITQASSYPYIQRGFMTSITKYLMEPNPYIAGNKRWIDSLPPGFLTPFIGLDGNYYGFAADTAAIWVYYNPQNLARIGMKAAPANWAEMLEACKRLKAQGMIPHSQPGGLGWPISWWFLFAESSLWASQFAPGTSLDVASWVRAVKKGQLKKTDDRTRQAWQLVKEFSQYWQLGTISNANANTFEKDFAAGKLTFIQDGSWNMGQLTTLIKGRFPLVALPAGIPPITRESSKYATGALENSGVGALNGIALWITKHAADHLDVVVDFLRYYASPQVMGPMALDVGEVPMVEGTGHLPSLVQQAKQVASQPGLLMTPYYNADTTFTNTYDKMANGYLAGAISLDTALSTLEQAQQVAATKLAAKIKM